MNQSIYKNVLLDHFRNPRNKGDMDNMHVVRRGSNPSCGDEIEVGVTYLDRHLDSVRFRGRGCSVCMASASMMSECVEGLEVHQAKVLAIELRLWIDGERDTPPAQTLVALDALRGHSARKKCVMLAWQALELAIDEVVV